MKMEFYMKHLKSLLIFILSFQLINISFLNAEEAIHPFNLRFDHQENLELISSYNPTLKSSVNSFLKDNKIDFNQLPKFQIQKIDTKTFEFKDRNESIRVTFLDSDQIKIQFNKKTFTINIKKENFTDWVKNFENGTSKTLTQFVFGLVIDDAHAISYALLIGVAVVLTALGIKYLGSTLPFETAMSKAKLSCESLKDEAREKDDLRIQNNLNLLNKAYAEKCAKNPSKKECISASELIECLNTFLKSKSHSNSEQRERKSSDASESNEFGNQSTATR